MIIDAKGSWDIFTFGKTISGKIPNKYWWQLQMYMWIKNRKHARLAYCLNNTPKEIVDRLVSRLERTFIGDKEDLKQAIKALHFKHNYDDIPMEKRIRLFDVERDEEAIEGAEMMIPHFRKFLKSLS